MDRKQETVAEWEDLRPIFNVCTRDTGYKGGVKLWVWWWRQAPADKQLKVMFDDILAEAREWRR